MRCSVSPSQIAITVVLFHVLAVSTPVLSQGNGDVKSTVHSIKGTTQGPIETDGTLDFPFDAGTVTNGWVGTAALQPDGKLLIGGDFSSVHGVPRLGIARLNADGTIDLGFDAGSAAGSHARKIVVQPDGKILIAGGITVSPFLRLNSDGSPDETFNAGSTIRRDQGTPVVYSIILQPDGKIIVVGLFSYILFVPRSGIARFNSDGTFDPSYDPGSGFVYSKAPSMSRVRDATVQRLGGNNGKLVVHGQFDSFNGHPALGLARLNPDGTFDDTFVADAGGVESYIYGILAQSDDEIVVVGGFTSFRGVPCSAIVRLNSFGGVDSGFNTAVFEYYGYTGYITDVTQQSDGKLIVSGDFHSLGQTTVNNIARLETTGARDDSFSGTAAGLSASTINTVLIRPDDEKIFVGGYFSTYEEVPRNNIAWVNSDGSVNSAFSGLSGVLGYYPHVYALGTQNDGKILVGGIFSSFNGTPHYNVVRLNPDSSIDSSFGLPGINGTVYALVIESDGKIVIAGDIGSVDGVPRGRIARLNSDGTLDPSFDPGLGANDSIYALALDATGSIYIGGAFTTFNDGLAKRVAKLTPIGALDSAFNPAGDGATNGTVYVITPPDQLGNILIGGSFTGYGSHPAQRIARLNATTGAFDTGFNQGASGFSGTVRALTTAPDGKYYAGGSFSMYSGIPRARIARLNSNGSLDVTFVASNGISQTVHALALQNGKVIAGGSSYDNPPGQLVRLTSSGELDASFVTGNNVTTTPSTVFPFSSPEVTALAIQSDGKLLIGGQFNQYDGNTRSCLARLATAAAGSPSLLGNISTRLGVETGDNTLIGGFIITGTQPKKVIIRAIGPSLSSFFPGALADPVLELRDSTGGLIRSNDNWRSHQEQEILATGIPPSDDLESAIVATLPANGSAYTAIVRGVNNGTGVGLVEAYDLDQTVDSKLANISTRGFVQTNDGVLIGGLIVVGQTPLRTVVRAIGPSLTVQGALADPTLELHDVNGALIVANDNWRGDQEAEIIATTIAPTNDLESAIVRYLVPGNYTAIVRGVGGTTGVALVEIYGLN